MNPKFHTVTIARRNTKPLIILKYNIDSAIDCAVKIQKETKKHAVIGLENPTDIYTPEVSKKHVEVCRKFYQKLYN